MDSGNVTWILVSGALVLFMTPGLAFFYGGMVRSKDRRLTTHVIRQSRLARYWMVPYNTGWHLAHHVDMGVPWRNLPRLHDGLVDAGWITPEITYPSYRAFWRSVTRSMARI